MSKQQLGKFDDVEDRSGGRRRKWTIESESCSSPSTSAAVAVTLPPHKRQPLAPLPMMWIGWSYLVRPFANIDDGDSRMHLAPRVIVFRHGYPICCVGDGDGDGDGDR